MRVPGILFRWFPFQDLRRSLHLYLGFIYYLKGRLVRTTDRLSACIIFFLAVSCTGSSQPVKDNDIHRLWLDCKLEGEVSFDIFNSAISGCRQIDSVRKKNLITIIDFSKPSDQERFFVIDLENRQLLFRCLVAHGKNSGENNAENFSNKPGSLKSSLGFFLTAETYNGDHGYSLKLDGLEKGINDSARFREIVIHGADYVSRDFIEKNGRLGRSWGCPALPLDVSKDVIDKISGGSCLFIFAKDSAYMRNSVFRNFSGKK